MSEEAEDLALLVHGALGLRPTGDVYALPITLGLRSTGASRKTDVRWRALDDLKNGARARPVLSAETVARIDGLREDWALPDRASVARRLIVAAALSLGLA